MGSEDHGDDEEGSRDIEASPFSPRPSATHCPSSTSLCMLMLSRGPTKIPEGKAGRPLDLVRKTEREGRGVGEDGEGWRFRESSHRGA
jgi:hypothetical protein